MVIGRLLGIESSDLKLLKSWSRALLGGIDLKRAGDQETAYAQAAQAAQDIGLYLKDLLTRRRAAPRADLMSRLAATDDVSDEELIANCALLLFAGHETTVNLIGNGLLALLRHPRELRRLREERALLPTAVEELLRYDSPAQMTFRFAMQPMELAGRSLQTGEPVGIVIGAANRDPSEFPDPQALNLGRSPNRHLSFGNARHACLGATLARLEGQIAFETWLDLCPHARLTDEPQQWLPSRGLRGLARLHIELA
jgi:cytochrome P450